MIDFNKSFTTKRLIEFADMIIEMGETIGFKVSSRGWCYLCEQAGYINKNQFDKVDQAINTCRKLGYLPVDFVAEEDARAFSGIEKPSIGPIKHTLDWMLRDVLNGHKYYTPDWWENEAYYIQVLVEKIDLKTLFSPVCAKYHIPIANAKGWSSILQRAEYARRFKEAEEDGKIPVLLYCGDHDPDGLRISDTIMTNLEQIKGIVWDDGTEGYDPQNLIIDRIGLNYDFIVKNRFTWIDNLITSSGKDLASRSHRNHNLPYVKSYLKEIGERKCEANVIVTRPTQAEELIREAIEFYLGTDSLERFEARREVIQIKYDALLVKTGLKPLIIKTLEDEEE
jgi:hypothetical protein